MQMHQIRYFLVLAEERNFTRAAKACGISQPSLTNAITALEQHLGGSLFRRRPRVALTQLGHAIRPHLRDIERNADQARRIARTLADDLRATPIASSAVEPRRSA